RRFSEHVPGTMEPDVLPHDRLPCRSEYGRAEPLGRIAPSCGCVAVLETCPVGLANRLVEPNERLGNGIGRPALADDVFVLVHETGLDQLLEGELQRVHGPPYRVGDLRLGGVA